MNESSEIVENPIRTSLPVGAGECLRQAREAAGLHIAALAVMLKVPVKKLEALEGNRFDLLPDAVFVRALAASVCRTLKIDSVPILALLPTTLSPRLTYRGAGINEEFRSRGDAPGPSVVAHLSKPAVWGGLALLLGALVLVFLPFIKSSVSQVTSSVADSPLGSLTGNDAQKPSDVAAQPGSSPIELVPQPGAMTSLRISPKSSVGVVEPVSEPTADSRPVKPGALSDASPFATPGVTPSTVTANANTTSTSDVVVFTAKGESWVEATDAKGRVVLRRTLAQGDVVGAAGLLPLKVVVGKANVTQVQVRGAGFDLNPVSKDNVARFEVK